jgi:hypothetical protein
MYKEPSNCWLSMNSLDSITYLASEHRHLLTLPSYAELEQILLFSVNWGKQVWCRTIWENERIFSLSEAQALVSYIWSKCLCSEARYVIESKLFMDNQQFDGSLYMYKVLQHFNFFLHYTFVIPIYFLPQDKFNIVHVPYRKINLKLFFSETS